MDNYRRPIATMLLVSALLVVSLSPPSAYAVQQVINLDDSGAGSLRAAIAAAAPGETITFQAGLSGTINLQNILAINKSLTIQGPGSDLVTLNTNSSGVIFSISGTAEVTIGGLTLREGNHANGGAIYAGPATTVTLNDMTLTSNRGVVGGALHNTGEMRINASSITNNRSDDGGGAIFNSGTLTITNSTIGSNVDTGQNDGGGAIYNEGSLALVETLIFSNTAALSGGGVYNTGTFFMQFNQFKQNAASGQGGAIYNSGLGRVTLSQISMTDNQSLGNGGAIYNTSLLTVTDSFITDNVAMGAGGNGGGIFNQTGGTILLSRMTLAANTASKLGGGLYNNNGSTATMERSTAQSNTATGGGGLFNLGNLTVERSTLSANRQQNVGSLGGGAIGTDGGMLTVINSTISNNIADHDGGGIDNYRGSQLLLANTTIVSNTSGANLSAGGVHSQSNGGVTMRNTIIAGNRNTQGGAPDCVGTQFSSQGYNFVGVGDGCNLGAVTGDQVGSENTPLSPQLGPLADNGGSIDTHAPLPNSPLIDAGSPATPGGGGGACEAVDQRGVARPQGQRCDIGAVELGGSPPAATQLAFTSQPISNYLAGQPFNQPINVQAVDANGTLVSSYSGTITLTLSGGAVGATLGGITTRQAENGVASFPQLSVDRAGTDYVLTASAQGLQSAASQSFSIGPVIVDGLPWLVLLYLAGDDDAEIGEEMLLLLSRLRYNPAARIVALYDGREAADSRIYTWEPGGLVDITEQAATDPAWLGGISGSPGARELDTGSPATVHSFVAWAHTAYPGSAYSFLAMIDHGGGWAPDFGSGPQPPGSKLVQAGGWRGMSQDRHSPAGPGLSSLSTRDTGTALAGGPPIDLLFFDACLMGMLESAYEVAPYADYFVAGQNLLFADFPYDRYLAPENLTASTTPEQLARTIVAQYNLPSSGFSPFTIAALDLRPLRGATGLAQRVDSLAAQLLALLPDGGAPVPLDNPTRIAMRAAYDAAQKFDYDSSLSIDPQDGYVDLVGFASQLSTNPSLSVGVRSAALAVIAEFEKMFIAKRTVSGRYEGRFWDLSQATGLSIFLPLAEQDWRPSRISGDAALPEDQLLYYVDPSQLAFSATAPNWAALLVRLQANTPVRAPSALTLAQADPRLSQPFSSPAPLDQRAGVMLPMVRR